MTDFLLFAHIVSTFLLMVGVTLAKYGGMRAARSEDLRLFRVSFQTFSLGGMIAFGATLLIVLTGTLTAWQQGIPLTGTGWLTASYVAVGVSLALPLVFIAPVGRRISSMMDGPERLSEQRQLIDSRRVRYTELALYADGIFVLAMMVFKPF